MSIHIHVYVRKYIDEYTFWPFKVIQPKIPSNWSGTTHRTHPEKMTGRHLFKSLLQKDTQKKSHNRRSLSRTTNSPLSWWALNWLHETTTRSLSYVRDKLWHETLYGYLWFIGNLLWQTWHRCRDGERETATIHYFLAMHCQANETKYCILIYK